jgi:hypothetical protein
MNAVSMMLQLIAPDVWTTVWFDRDGLLLLQAALERAARATTEHHETIRLRGLNVTIRSWND